LVGKSHRRGFSIERPEERIHHRGTEEDEGAQREDFFFFAGAKKKKHTSMVSFFHERFDH
jgi:hypothetical protein